MQLTATGCGVNSSGRPDCQRSAMDDLIETMNGRTRSRGMLALGAIAIIGLYMTHALKLGYVVDDAYISFQYARHFAHGEGLVYNVGERVEGYTNFLWVIMLG